MNQATATALVLAAILAGCTGATEEPAAQRQSLSASTEATPGAAAESPANASLAGLSTAAASALYLLPDGTLSLAPASAAGEVALAMPVNGPVWDDDDYPKWRASFAQDVNLTGSLAVRVFATTTSAALAGSNAPVFAGAPPVIFQVSVGGEGPSIDLQGPATMQAGQVAEFGGTLHLTQPFVIPAGQEIEVTTIVIYTHVAAAADFRIVMGPDHPTGLAP